MGKLMIKGQEASGSFSDASLINYDNTKSGAEAETVQDAIDEVNKSLTALDNNFDTNRITMGLTSNYADFTCPSDGLIFVSSESTEQATFINGIPFLFSISPLKPMTCRVFKGDIIQTVNAPMWEGGYFYPHK